MNWSTFWSALQGIWTVWSLIRLIILWYKEKNDKHTEFWHNNLPILSLTSPCDCTQYYCDADLNDFPSSFPERGNKLFSIPNFSKVVAYNIQICISGTEDFTNSSNVKRYHYINEIPPTNISMSLSPEDYVTMMYSKFHINPDTKDANYDEFKICDLLRSCSVTEWDNCKVFYVKMEYDSSPSLQYNKRIKSIFKICARCINNETMINYILRQSYELL